MNVDLNLKLKLEIDDGYLYVKLVSQGEYPYYEEKVEDEAYISLSQLKRALEDE